MSSYQTRGIILHKTDWGETGQLFSIYTDSYGKIEAAGRGTKKIKSKLNSHLQVFSLTRLMVAHGRMVDQLASAQLEQQLLGSAPTLQKIILGSFMVELVNQLTKPHQADQQVFQLLKSYLADIGSEAVLTKARCHSLQRQFTIMFLTLLGYQPNSDLGSAEALKHFLYQHLDYELQVKKFVTNAALDDWLPVC